MTQDIHVHALRTHYAFEFEHMQHAYVDTRIVLAADVQYVADRKAGRMPRSQFQAEHGALD